VEGGLSAAVDFHNRVGEKGFHAEAAFVSAAADGIDGVVFQQEERLGAKAFAEVCNGLFLDGEGIVVGDAVEGGGGEGWIHGTREGKRHSGDWR